MVLPVAVCGILYKVNGMIIQRKIYKLSSLGFYKKNILCTLQEHQKFRSKTEISIISDNGFIIEVCGISYFEVCSLQW